MRDRLEESALLRLLPERALDASQEDIGLILVTEERDVRGERRDRRARDRRRELVEGDPLEVNGARATLIGEAVAPDSQAIPIGSPVTEGAPPAGQPPRTAPTLRDAAEAMKGTPHDPALPNLWSDRPSAPPPPAGGSK
jgi:hypothetical protein